MIATLFFNPLTISSGLELWLLLPLCAAVGLVYKTVRTEQIDKLPSQFLRLMGLMFGGLVLLCLAMWLIHTYFPCIC